jgi:cell division protein FtsW
MPDKVIFYIVLTFLIGGVVFTYSLSYFVSTNFHQGEYAFMMKQLFFAVLSITTIWIISRLNPHVWIHRIGMILFGGGLFAIILMIFLPESIVPKIGGASRWIKVFGLSIAPVEFFKIGFVYFIAWSMSRKIESHHGKTLKEEFKIFLPYIIVFVVSVVNIAVLQKDLGQSMVLALTFLILAFFAGGSGRFVYMGIATFFFLFVIFTVTFPHRLNRIASWWAGIQEQTTSLLPESIRDYFILENVSGPYQVSQSLGAINNGGLWGQGLGNGIFKYGYLPEVHTDFILEGIAEETGFASILVIFFLFALLVQRILKVANRSDEQRYTLFSIGIGMIISLTLLINTYGSTGLIPMKGLPVPFLSYGGSSMLALSIGIGMVLMISKISHVEKDISEPLHPPIDTNEYNGINLLKDERDIEYIEFDHDEYFDNNRNDRRNAYSKHPEF